MNETNSKTIKQPESADTVDVRVLKALGHPIRQRILQALNEEISSPNQIARKIDEPLSNVSYHVKILVGCDAIELVDTKPVRGALEHFYRATMRARLEDEHWRALPESSRTGLTNQTLNQIWRHVGEAAEAGGFNDPESAVVWVDLQLDDEAYAELSDEIVRLVNHATDLQAEAAVRLAELDDDGREKATHRTELDLLHYHRA